MKILVDNNLPLSLARRLRDLSHEAQHLRELHYHKMPDRLMWSYAIEHGYAILTKDYDFCTYSDLYGHPPKVIWLGIGNQSRHRTVEIVLSCEKQIDHFMDLPDKSLLVIS